MPGRNHASPAAPPRTRATAGNQRASRETPAPSRRQHTRSCPGELLERQSSPEKILRKPRGKCASVNRVSDKALEAAGPVPASGLGSPLERTTSCQAVVSEDSTYSVQEDSVGSWYRNVGYLTALDQSAIDVLEQVLPLVIMADIKRSAYKSKGDRAMGLDDRNVRLDPCLPTDPFLATFHDLQPLEESKSAVYLPDVHEEVKQYHVNQWRLDLDKAIKDELEATFQRTIMMSMLDRFRLMYNLRYEDQSVLDFAVESTWNCPFMPTRALKKVKPDRQRVLSRPKPDISVAFHLRSVIEEGAIGLIPEVLKRIMIYENPDATRTQRAFHFLMFEAKNADKTSSDKDGQLQSLNCASQSLHCLYEFFNEADRQEVECRKPCCTPGPLTTTNGNGGQHTSSDKEKTFVDRFFEEVRVFTAVPTGRGISIRVHRACPASSEYPFPPHQGRPPWKHTILPDYPLQFEYNELVNFTNDDFNRGKVVETFKKIMVDYGIGQLRPLLRRAATAITVKFLKWEEENGAQYVLGMRHYSHGQTAPPASRKTSQAASQGSRWSSESATSSPGPPSRIRRGSSSALTNSQEPQYYSSTEREIEPPRKRTRKA